MILPFKHPGFPAFWLPSLLITYPFCAFTVNYMLQFQFIGMVFKK